MSPQQARRVDDLAAVVRDAAKSLTARDISVLVSHPNLVRSALAVAARTISDERDEDAAAVETLGAGALAARVGDAEVRRRIAHRTGRADREQLLTSDEFASRLGLKTRQSVHVWLRKRRIVGWSGAKRSYVFPAGQLDERNRPCDGLDRVIAFFDDGYAAWIWLTTPLAALEGATPIALLHRGEVERVVAAAEGDAQGDFA